MPKIVDHEKRRAEIAEALWRVVARDGVNGVTIRAVATEAGFTRGVVEHYFPNKREMSRYACRLARDRILAALRRNRTALSGREALRAFLLEYLGTSSTGHRSVDTWIGLLSIIARDSELAADFVSFDEQVRAEVAEIVGEMIAHGEASADITPQTMAHHVRCYHLGMAMTVHALPTHYPPEAVVAEVETFLDEMARGLQAEGS